MAKFKLSRCELSELYSKELQIGPVEVSCHAMSSVQTRFKNDYMLVASAIKDGRVIDTDFCKYKIFDKIAGVVVVCELIKKYDQEYIVIVTAYKLNKGHFARYVKKYN